MTATLQEIGALIGIVGGVFAIGGGCLWLWIEARARKVFPTREEHEEALNGIGKRVDRHGAKLEALEEFTEKNIGELREFKAGIEAVKREGGGAS